MPFHQSPASLAGRGDDRNESREIVPTVPRFTNANCADGASVPYSLTVIPIMEVASEKPVGWSNAPSPGCINSGGSAHDTNDAPIFTRPF